MSSGVWGGGGGGREGGARSPSREQRRSIPPHKVVKGRERGRQCNPWPFGALFYVVRLHALYYVKGIELSFADWRCLISVCSTSVVVLLWCHVTCVPSPFVTNTDYPVTNTSDRAKSRALPGKCW